LLRRSNGPRFRIDADRSCRTTHRARADTSAASVAAHNPPTCLREGGVPVTPAAPGALADWIDWLQSPLGPFLAPAGLFLPPLLGPLPLLDQATLSRFTSSSPVPPLPFLFHFDTLVTVHISIPFAAQGKGSQPPSNLTCSPTLTTSPIDRSRRVFHRAKVQRQRKRPSRPA
jgi:hypothetical protein